MRDGFNLGRMAASLLVCLYVFLSTNDAYARLVQILHTNDLHSHFEQAEDRSIAGIVSPDKPKGGYAHVKALIEKMRAEAASQGVESIVVDAGDFSEGAPFFLADKGEVSWRVMNAMGYDAVTIGNHDCIRCH